MSSWEVKFHLACAEAFCYLKYRASISCLFIFIPCLRGLSHFLLREQEGCGFIADRVIIGG